MLQGVADNAAVGVGVQRSARQADDVHPEEGDDHGELASGEMPEGEGSGETLGAKPGGGLSLGKILGFVFLVKLIYLSTRYKTTVL